MGHGAKETTGEGEMKGRRNGQMRKEGQETTEGSRWGKPEARPHPVEVPLRGPSRTPHESLKGRAVRGEFRAYLPRILLTQPWLTRSWREMSQGLTPWWARSTMRWRTTSGRGLPFTKAPPSWFSPPWPETQ